MRARDCVLVLALALGLATAASAAEKDSREREALRRVQQNAAKLQAEKTALEREKQELTAKMDTTAKELGSARGEAARQKRLAAALDKEVETLRSENAALKTQFDATSKSLADTSRQCQADGELARQNQKRVEAINGNLKAMHEKEEAERKSCVANNLKLKIIAHEILDRYQRKGVWQGLLQAEPFTQIKSVEIENLVQDYQDRIDDLKAGIPAQ
jgi:chromosome segregation ATPase